MIAGMAAGGATSDLVGLLQALVRSEIAKLRIAEIGVVTDTFPHESAGDTNNYACDIKLRDSGLELKKVPVAVQRIGHVAIPNVDDLVLVQFVGGDLHGAVITGRLYNDVDRPAVGKVHENVYICPDDAESGVRRAYFEFPNGNTVLVDDDKLVADMGGSKITIKNGGDVEIVAQGGMTLQSGGDMTFKASGDIKMEADGAVSVKAATDMKLESGSSLQAKADGSVKVAGGATASVESGIVNIKGIVNFSS